MHCFVTDISRNSFTDLCYRLMTGTKITNVEEAWHALELLHERGPQTVVLSSTELGSDDHLLGLASSHAGKVLTFASIVVFVPPYQNHRFFP